MKLWNKLSKTAKIMILSYFAITVALTIIVTFVAASTYWLYGSEAMVFRGFFVVATFVATGIVLIAWDNTRGI